MRAPGRPASARASRRRSATRRLIRFEERSAESTTARSSSRVGILERGLQQLEVGDDAGQRRAELVRGVGDELALLAHRSFALGAGGVERAQHLLQGFGELTDLVVGLGHRHIAGGVAGVADFARGRGQRGDRAHRATGDRQPGEGGEQGRAEDAGGDEEPEAVDRRVDVVFVAPVLDVAGDAAGLAAAQGRRSRPACRRRDGRRGRGRRVRRRRGWHRAGCHGSRRSGPSRRLG